MGRSPSRTGDATTTSSPSQARLCARSSACHTAGRAPGTTTVSAPIALWVRADWRHRYLSLIALALVAGLAFAIAMTAFAGARRTATSFDRLLAETHAYDGGIVIDSPGDGTYDAATVDRLRALPQVANSAEVVFYVVSVPGADSELSLFAPADGTLGTTIETDRVLRGRMPAPDRADEVVVNETAVAKAHVDIGSVLTLQTLTPDQRLRILAGDAHAVD